MSTVSDQALRSIQIALCFAPFLLRQLVVVGTGILILLAVWRFPQLRIGREVTATFAVLLIIGVIIICTASCIATLYRILVPKPALIVTAEGIYDLCSCIVSGVGLVSWHEIRAVIPTEYWRVPVFTSLHRRRDPFLVIVPEDWRALKKRLPATRRLLLAVTHVVIWSPPGYINIPEFMLGTRVGAVMSAVRLEYLRLREHTPHGHSIPMVSMPW